MDKSLNKSAGLILLTAIVIAVAAVSLTFISPDNMNERTEKEKVDISPTNRTLNVVVVDADRLTSSHMPCYGYRRNTTPNICSFAQDNVWFRQSVSNAGFTLGNLGSILTGSYPNKHELLSQEDSLNKNIKTLPEILQQNSYRTAAFTGYKTRDTGMHVPHPGTGLPRGFERYDGRFKYLDGNVPASLEWIDNTSEPFFLYVQGFDVLRYANIEEYLHTGPYSPEEERYRQGYDSDYDGRFQDEEFLRQRRPWITEIKVNDSFAYVNDSNGNLIKLKEEDLEHITSHYDGEARYADYKVGRFLDGIKRRGLMNNTIVIVLGNHGQIVNHRTFASDRLFGPGVVLEGDIRPPLAMHIPGMKDKVVEKQVQMVDLMPTVLELLSIETPKTVQGESLMPLIDNTSDKKYDSKYAYSMSYQGTVSSVRTDKWKLINWSTDFSALFNLSEEPVEQKNVLAQNPDVTERLRSQLKEFRKGNLS